MSSSSETSAIFVTDTPKQVPANRLLATRIEHSLVPGACFAFRVSRPCFMSSLPRKCVKECSAELVRTS